MNFQLVFNLIPVLAAIIFILLAIRLAYPCMFGSVIQGVYGRHDKFGMFGFGLIVIFFFGIIYGMLFHSCNSFDFNSKTQACIVYDSLTQKISEVKEGGYYNGFKQSYEVIPGYYEVEYSKDLENDMYLSIKGSCYLTFNYRQMKKYLVKNPQKLESLKSTIKNDLEDSLDMVIKKDKYDNRLDILKQWHAIVSKKLKHKGVKPELMIDEMSIK